jgi:hypothetical protein
MSVTQTVEIPASRRLTIDVPREIPVGRAVLVFNPVTDAAVPDPKSRRDPRTTEEALIMAEERAADPNRKPLSRHFGTLKGLWDGDAVAYQRALRDEWD